MKDIAVAELMEAVVEPADDAVADWSDVLRRAEPDPARNGAAPLPPSVRKPRRRRRLALQIAFTALVLVAAGVAAVVLRGGGKQSVPKSAAEVTRRTQSAMVDARELIVHTVQFTNGARTSEGWEDGEDTRRVTTIFRDGQRESANQIEVVPGKVRMTNVSYDAKTWSSFSLDVPAGAGRPTMTAGQSESLREQLARGDLRLVGSEEFDGRDVLHLTRTLPGHSSGLLAAGPMRLDIWVDADTYLPFRWISAGSINGAAFRTTIDYEWLPRTEENVARTKLTIPASFRKATSASSSVIQIRPQGHR